MEEFEPSSEAWNRVWKSSSQVQMLGIGIGGVRSKLRCLESEIVEFETSSEAWNRPLGIGNGGVQAKFGSLESEFEEIEPSSEA